MAIFESEKKRKLFIRLVLFLTCWLLASSVWLTVSSHARLVQDARVTARELVNSSTRMNQNQAMCILKASGHITRSND